VNMWLNYLMNKQDVPAYIIVIDRPVGIMKTGDLG